MLAKPLSRCCWWCWGWWWCLPPASSSWSPPSWQRPRRGGRGGEGVSFVTQLTFPPSLLGPFTQFGQSPGCLCCCTSTSEVQSTASEAVEGVLLSPNPSRKGSVIAFWSFHCVFVHHVVCTNFSSTYLLKILYSSLHNWTFFLLWKFSCDWLFDFWVRETQVQFLERFLRCWTSKMPRPTHPPLFKVFNKSNTFISYSPRLFLSC